MLPPESKALTDEERAVCEWQLDVPGHGLAGQERLKGASVLVSRTGGLGSVVAYELAAAGVGRLVLAHGGEIKHSDLNRQLLMTHDALGSSRVESAKRRLLELNPRLEVLAIPENACAKNAERLVSEADVVVDCAPLFEERLALNAACVAQGKPMVEAAMFELQISLTSILPGQSPCLACLHPTPPAGWKRRFPVFGAVSGMVAGLAAMETIKLLSGFGETLAGRLLTCDLRDMSMRSLRIKRRADCPQCSHLFQ